jgi:hypothetical protein
MCYLRAGAFCAIFSSVIGVSSNVNDKKPVKSVNSYRLRYLILCLSIPVMIPNREAFHITSSPYRRLRCNSSCSIGFSLCLSFVAVST